MQGQADTQLLWMMRQELQMFHRVALSYTILAESSTEHVFNMQGAFTAPKLGLKEHSYPITALQWRVWEHLTPVAPCGANTSWAIWNTGSS